MGVYGNGTYKINGVKIQNLADHIKYNINFRTGRALFVNGVCVHHGFLSIPEVLKWENKLQDPNNATEFQLTEDTAPYI